jgi:hypothetical protein
MASTRLEEAVQPLRDVVDSFHGLMLRFGSFLERAEAALSRLSLSLAELHTAPELHPLVMPDVGSTDESGGDLYGSFSPRVEASSTFVAPVLQIMLGLQELCAELVLLQSDEPAKVDPLEVSIPALAPSQTLGFEECGVVGVRHVVPVGDAMSKKGVAGG